MTFDEAINYATPAFENLAIIEPWTSGGTLSSRLVISHHEDLPKVYGFVWRLHPDYAGPIRLGDMIYFPRYGYEVILEGSSEDEGKWQLAAINLDVVECVLELTDEDLNAVAETYTLRP